MMQLARFLVARTAPVLLLVTLSSGCAWLKPGIEKVASTPPPPAAAVAPERSASAVPPGTPQPAGPPPGSPKAFAAVIKGAAKLEGLFTLYQKDEKVWIELKPGDFDKPFFLSPKLATGIGEARLYAGLMQEERVIEFRRIHNQVQMIARNTDFIARAGTPEGRAVAASFSPSLLASTAVESQPQPHSQAVLVDANALFVNDMLGIGMRLQQSFRQGYAFDARNSAITTLRVKPQGVVLQMLAHFATGSVSASRSGTSGTPGPRVPFTLPDPRSLFVTVHYVIAPLPEQPMRSRLADARVGFFTASQWDFSDDLVRSPIVRHVARWRLEKKDPAQPMSEPATPIVYWLDRTIPVKYRGAIRAGILEWNRAFERIGFKNAIEVRDQPDDAEFDTLDGGASVRWMTDAAPSFGAIGPSHVDPRSGEILGANIGIQSLSSRSLRASRAQILNASVGDFGRMMQTGIDNHDARGDEPFDERACANADQAAEQLSYAIDVLAARGELDPDGHEAQQFVLDYLKDTTMHEVGHTLGLRHNFRASRLRTDAQLSDPEFTRNQAVTGSVMEYAPINLASAGAPPVAPFQSTLGPYDLWAIEYAYRPIEPAMERAELARIAARSVEPELAFGTDEDNYLGIDPDALHFDLGNDPLVFARKRIEIARDLLKRQEYRSLAPDGSYAVLRRSLNFAINDTARAVGMLARQIGGVRTLRDHPGSGRDPLQPVAARVQREALDLLSYGLFAADSLVVSPALQRRLAPDFQERAEALERGGSPVATDYSLTQRVLTVQRALLAQLMSDAVAARVLDSQGKAARGDEAFQLSELYGRLGRDIWIEVEDARPNRAAPDIPAPRRALQREHLNRVAELLLRPSASGRADARSLVRTQAQGLLVQLDAAAKRRAFNADTRAHLLDSADTLRQALSAPVIRTRI